MKYKKIASELINRINGKRYKLGDQLPSEIELSAQFGVSRQTIRNSLKLLESEGFIERIKGSGTYVRKTNAPTPPKRKVIGLISPFHNDYIFPLMIQGVNDVLVENGYSLQLYVTKNKVEIERRVLNEVIHSDLAGLITEPAKSALPNPNMDLYTKIKNSGLPVIQMNAFLPNLDFPVIAMDDFRAGEMAAQYLVNRGHKIIGGIFRSDDQSGQRRYAGFINTLRETNLLSNEDHILWLTIDEILSLDLIHLSELIKTHLRGCSAVFCYNDQLSFRLLSHFKENGIAVPEDISIISCDNSRLAEFASPPLTSIVHPKEEVGILAAENILRLIADPTLDISEALIPTLVERESVTTLY
jgi:GntR family transcriptional regulator of arabinose operon